MDSIIFTRIKELCAENEITVNKLETELGMSQYSANQMAKEGGTYDSILQYFFEGTEIKEVAEILLDVE